jgi:hypothetical protein
MVAEGRRLLSALRKYQHCHECRDAHPTTSLLTKLGKMLAISCAIKPNWVVVAAPLPIIHAFQLNDTGLRFSIAARELLPSSGATLVLRRWSDAEQLVAEVPLPIVQVTAGPETMRLPFASTSSTDLLLVAVAVEVAMNRMPPAFLKVHALSPEEPSVRATWGPVAEASAASSARHAFPQRQKRSGRIQVVGASSCINVSASGVP